MKISISPSILTANFIELGTEIDSISCADYIHFDVMDGSFVPNITVGLPILKSVKEYTSIPIDTHLMVNNPQKLIEKFIENGSDLISFHIEATDTINAHKCIDLAKKYDKKIGIAIKPNTSFDCVIPFLNYIDFVLIMTVEPGFGGQVFIDDMINKINFAKAFITKNNINCSIEVDGGINYETAKLVVNAGADILVSGSYIFNSNDRNNTINSLRLI